MSVDQDDKLLSEWIDGELDAGSAAALKQRLRDEPALAKRLDLLQQASSSVKSYFASDAKQAVVTDRAKEEFIRTTFSGGGGAARLGESQPKSKRGWLALVVIALIALLAWLGVQYLKNQGFVTKRRDRCIAALASATEGTSTFKLRVTSLADADPTQTRMRILHAASGSWSIKCYANSGLPKPLQSGRHPSIVGSTEAPAWVAFDGRRLWAAPTESNHLVWKSAGTDPRSDRLFDQLAEVIASTPGLEAERPIWLAAIATLGGAAAESFVGEPLSEKPEDSDLLRVDLNLKGLDGVVRAWVRTRGTPRLERVDFGIWRLDFDWEAVSAGTGSEGFGWEAVSLPAGLIIEPL